MEDFAQKYVDLITKSLTGDITQEEREYLDKWLDADQRHRDFYERMVFSWKASGLYQKTNDRERSEDWEKITGKINPETTRTAITQGDRRAHSGKVRSYEFLKMAAVFIFAFSLAWLTYHYFPDISGKNKKETAFFEVITKKGQKTRVILPDGTLIWLNAQSRLKYPSSFDNNNRQVFLSGEAFFKVTKTSDRQPFLVKTNDLTIRVTGTEFNVKAYPEEDVVETTLVEGAVTLLRKTVNGYQTLELKPDQKATLLKKGAGISVRDIRSDRPTLAFMNESSSKTTKVNKEKIVISPEVNIESHTAWKKDQLIFEQEPFEDIAYQLERWFDVIIVFQDPSLKQNCYTGKFIHKESLEQILRVIQLTTPFRYKIDKNRVIIYK